MVLLGIDNLLVQNPSWKKRPIALLTNHAATTRQLVPSGQALLENGFAIQKLFSPEHGLNVKGADGHLMKDGVDALTQLPVISLYSEKLLPSEENLSGIDIVLFDIPDVGSRFYTYLWTMTYMMEACAALHKKFIILDRPNPISGRMELAEGPMLDETQASFIGRWPIPVRHSCTIGELATYFNVSRNMGCQLEVIKCTGWERNMFHPDWGIPFVPTSPAIQNFQSMLLYPGLCLLEATNISEGRGTPYSFTAAGAPWLDAYRLSENINNMGLDEIQASPLQFTSPNGKYQGRSYKGIELKVIRQDDFQPVFFGLLLVKLIREMHPAEFAWKPYPTLVNPEGVHHLDKLLGIPDTEKIFELPLQKFIAQATKMTDAGDWGNVVYGSLLY